MAKYRHGKFWWEYKSPHYITLESMRGAYDPALTSDCRCGKECNYCEFGNYCELRPWTALSSVEAWGDDILTPQGLPDGDTLDPEREYIPFEERLACDIFGRSYDELDRENELDLSEFILLDNISRDEDLPLQNFRSIGFREMPEDDVYGKYEKELDDLIHEALTMEIKCYQEASEAVYGLHEEELDFSIHEATSESAGYDHRLDDLPKKLPKSPDIVSKDKVSPKKIIRTAMKKGFYVNHRRGNDRYKDKQRRLSSKKRQRIAKHFDKVFVYNLAKGQVPRTLCS